MLVVRGRSVARRGKRSHHEGQRDRRCKPSRGRCRGSPCPGSWSGRSWRVLGRRFGAAGFECLHAADIANEAIAQAMHGGDIARMARAVTQRMPQLRDGTREHAWRDMPMPPCRVEQIIFADDISGTQYQRDEHGVGFGLHREFHAGAFDAMCSRLDDDVIALINPAAVRLGLGHNLAWWRPPAMMSMRFAQWLRIRHRS